MEKERKLAYLNMARKAEMWMFVYVGMGIGFTISEYALWSVTHGLTYLSFAALFSFAAALVNHHVKTWAMKKVGCHTDDGINKVLNDLEK